MTHVTDMEVLDVRFPTSRQLDGSDAMNPDPDYSAAYVVLHTDADDGLEGHGFTFTIGRGTEVVCAAVEALRPLVVGYPVEDACSDMGRFWRTVTRDSQLRWIGPEKGAIHLATAAVVNAMWDLFAKREGKPLWKLLADMSPEQLVALVDWRYLTDALTAEEAVSMLRERESGRREREERLLAEGLPSYTTSAGWLGYDDDKLRRLCQEAVDAGWSHVKLKVGADLEDDVRRCRIAREIIGPDRKLMVDANQRWDVDEAVEAMRRLAEVDPWWIEEPTSPDDILGHAHIAHEIAPIRVATGEHVHNRVMFKQLLQAEALGFCQIDACRLGGVNEAVAVLLLAARYGVPVCPHAGGVGLCELVQHLSAFDFVAVSGSLDDVVVEYVDHLHEHFVDPVRTSAGRYLAPRQPGYSAEMRRETLADFSFPDGPVWRQETPPARSDGVSVVPPMPAH
jgi:L-fuconate dehydratase